MAHRLEDQAIHHKENWHRLHHLILEEIQTDQPETL
jgi:hypothetical protein